MKSMVRTSLIAGLSFVLLATAGTSLTYAEAETDSIGSLEVPAMKDRCEDAFPIGAARSLKAKLQTASHFEEKGEPKKALKHMAKFMEKLEHWHEKAFISDYAYNVLDKNAVFLMSERQQGSL